MCLYTQLEIKNPFSSQSQAFYSNPTQKYTKTTVLFVRITIIQEFLHKNKHCKKVQKSYLEVTSLIKHPFNYNT